MTSFMDKLQVTVERWLMPFATKLNSNKIIKAIMAGMLGIIPITIVGSLFTILTSFPYQPYLDWLNESNIKPLLSVPIYATTDLLALISCYLTASAYVKNEGEDPTIPGILAIAAFLTVTPLSVVAGETAVKAIPFDYLGARGIFVGLLVALLVSSTYIKVAKSRFTIKMPEGVPPMVQNSFSALVPSVIIMVAALLVRIGFSYTSFVSIHAFVYGIIQKPLMNLGSNPISIIILTLLNSLLWFFGIHSIAVNSIVSPVLRALDMENLVAVQAGMMPENIITWNFFQMTAKVGATGCTLGICIYMIFFAKSKRYKTLGKVGLPANLFNINEPIIFGVPIMLNPILMIPFVIAPIINFLISYAVVAIGLVRPISGLTLPTETPAVIAGFLQGGVSFAILQVLLIILSTFIYLPFFRIVDKKAYLEETSAESGE